jgi:predicted CXXCH cytochrome family protein
MDAPGHATNIFSKLAHQPLPFFLGSVWFLFLTAFIWNSEGSGSSTSPAPPSDPDAVCASCHLNIYRQYRQSAMARGSGPAAQGFIPADFFHKESGIHYAITSANGHVYLSYERPPGSKDAPLKGEEELLYYLGSGKRGRTFLFQREGYWFEIPINWYAKKGIWDMAPNYQQAKEMPLTLPVDSSCLHCHASGVQAALPQARNRYAATPFLYGGITCEGCHGDASQHVAQHGRGPILNPDKLAANKRDSICLQCHLEAEVLVNRRGHTLYDFKPGGEISDDIVHFVHRNTVGAGGRATSQWEALLQSACKRQSGDRLTCTTCHDPHRSIPAEESVAYYRNKCLACHTDAKFATAHHPEQQNCAACHMPTSNTRDIAHEQVTDHRIQIPGTPTLSALTDNSSRSNELAPVRGTASARDLGVAYSRLAVAGNREAGEQALRFLREAEQESNEASSLPDPILHTRLGFLDQISGDTATARKEYQLAVAEDPFDATAAGNIALIDAREGDLKSAAGLWASVFEHDPTQKAAGFNLAATECQLGDGAAAKRVLDRMLLFSPDDQRAKQIAAAIVGGSQHCPSR